jgi:phosphotriesterase-related protein
MASKCLMTVKGPVKVEEFGLVLPHEHLFTDLRGPHHPGYAQGDPDKVIEIMQPNLEAAARAGVSALVECTPGGVGRNVEMLARLAAITPIHIVAPAGIYKEEYHPPAYLELDEVQLAEIITRELQEGIDGSEVRAGFIKLAASGDGPTEIEQRNLRAAVRASRQTGAVIACHTEGAAVAQREIAVLEAAGLDLSRFIWVHASLEPDVETHLAAAEKGVYVEYDTINCAAPDNFDYIMTCTLEMLETGLGDRLLLSHDAGWYDPAHPDGWEGMRGYTEVINDFIPALQKRGVDDATIRMLTHDNPLRAFALDC